MQPQPDLLFGKIAVKAGLLTEEQVKFLLRKQVLARRTGKRASLGDLCQQNGLLTPQQVQKVLLAQQYTQLREEDKRIGALAVKNGFATLESIQFALDEQQNMYRSERKIPKRLGEILVEAEIIDAQQLDALLTAQTRLQQESIGARRPSASAVGQAKEPTAETVMTENSWFSWWHVLRDVAILWALTCLGGFVLGVVGVAGGTSPERDALVIGMANFVFGVVAFVIAGCRKRERRLLHLMIVALVGWLTSLVNLCFGVSLTQWLLGIVLFSVWALVGGGISFLIVRSHGKWYLASGGKTYGPYTEEQLGKFVAERRANPDSQVCAQGSSEWVRLGDTLPDLFAGAEPPPPPPPPREDVSGLPEIITEEYEAPPPPGERPSSGLRRAVRPTPARHSVAAALAAAPARKRHWVPWLLAGVVLGGLGLLIAWLYSMDENVAFSIGSMHFQRGTTDELNQKVRLVVGGVVGLHLLIFALAWLGRRRAGPPTIPHVPSPDNRHGVTWPALALLFLGGGVLGVSIVRVFLLDPLEELAWTMFWGGIGEGRMMNMGIVLKSATFWKCVAGFLLSGGLVSFVAAKKRLPVFPTVMIVVLVAAIGLALSGGRSASEARQASTGTGSTVDTIGKDSESARGSGPIVGQEPSPQENRAPRGSGNAVPEAVIRATFQELDELLAKDRSDDLLSRLSVVMQIGEATPLPVPILVLCDPGELKALPGMASWAQKDIDRVYFQEPYTVEYAVEQGDRVIAKVTHRQNVFGIDHPVSRYFCFLRREGRLSLLCSVGVKFDADRMEMTYDKYKGLSIWEGMDGLSRDDWFASGFFGASHKVYRSLKEWWREMEKIREEKARWVREEEQRKVAEQDKERAEIAAREAAEQKAAEEERRKIEDKKRKAEEEEKRRVEAENRRWAAVGLAAAPLRRGRVDGRQERVRSAGGSEATEKAVLEGLRWLARHQSADGHWDSANFMDECGKIVKGGWCSGHGYPNFNPGLTGLSLLAFLGAGYTHLSKDVHDGICFGEVVKKGLQWMMTNQDGEGYVGGKSGSKYIYNHSIAALAFSEAYGMTSAQLLKDPAEKAIQALLAAQNPYKGWRYTARCGDNDSSVTGWCVMALKSAEISGLGTAQTGYAGTKAWFDEVTSEDFKVGYNAKGTGQVVVAGQNEHFGNHEALTAIGMMARIFINKNRNDPKLKGGADLLIRDLPVWDGNKLDFYYWYYTSLALFQFDGPSGPMWKAWNEPMKNALVPNQKTGKDGCANGSWDTNDRWGFEGGRVYATAINALTLEVYYRYPLMLASNGPSAQGPKTGQVQNDTATKNYVCVGCQKQVRATPGTTGKCPHCGKLLTFTAATQEPAPEKREPKAAEVVPESVKTGDDLLSKERYDDAFDQYERALKYDANNVKALLGLALIYEAKWKLTHNTNFKDALEKVAGRIIELDPKNRQANLFMVGVALWRERKTAAIQYATVAISLAPKNPEGYVARARAYKFRCVQTGEGAAVSDRRTALRAAIADYEKASALDARVGEEIADEIEECRRDQEIYGK